MRAAGIPCALVTMSYRRLTDLLEAALPEPLFDVVVCGDEVARGKPLPDPYLAAAAALGVDPLDCVAIEDSEAGMRSAVAAGVPTIVVPSVKPVPRDAWLGAAADVARVECRRPAGRRAGHREVGLSPSQRLESWRDGVSRSAGSAWPVTSGSSARSAES